LDVDYVQALGKFEVVYSWGVLHHTGAMWQALEQAAIPVADGGRLFLAIYNDQEGKSNRWRMVKRLYCKGLMGRNLVTGIFFPTFFSEDLQWMCYAVIIQSNDIKITKKHVECPLPQTGMIGWEDIPSKSQKNLRKYSISTKREDSV